MLRGATLGFLLLGSAGSLAAQSRLRLSEAFHRADASAYVNRIAAGSYRAQAAQATNALQGILPSIRAEGGFVRTDDPLAAFGFTLQQRGVSPASFDPASLNRPAPVTNWSGGVVAEVPILNADAWFGRAAASSAAAASAADAGWVRETTRVEVVRAYFGAVLAHEQVSTLDAALAAATAHERQAQSMVANGLATRSDALLATLQRGQVEARLIETRGEARIARNRLAVLLGEPDDTGFTLPDSLPSGDRIRSMLAGSSADSGAWERLDLAAARLGFEAARGNVRRAGARLLPRVNGFGRLGWNSSDRLFGGSHAFTLGVMASWSLFGGGSELADRQTARGRADAALAMSEAAEAGASLERQSTLTRLEVALARLGIAEASVAQSVEAHRLVARKYDGGLATIAELLGAAALETSARLDLSQARFLVIVAHADVRKAAGADLTAFTVLEN